MSRWKYREDPERDERDEEADREEEVVRPARDHLRVPVGVQPREVPLRPAHAEREHPDDHDLAVAEGRAVEARVRRAVVVGDEEAVEEVEGVERDPAQDRRPGELEHLADEPGRDARDEVAHPFARGDDEDDAGARQGCQEDPLDAVLPDRDEEDAEDDHRHGP
jgi:hypothetical protein